MQFKLTLLAALAATTSLVKGCLVLEGNHYRGTNRLDATIKDNGIELCSYHSTWTTDVAWFNCVDGTFAFLRRSDGPEYLPQSTIWDAFFASDGNIHNFRVDASQNLSGRRDIGTHVYAANYGC